MEVTMNYIYAKRQDTPLILQFIKELAEYEEKDTAEDFLYLWRKLRSRGVAEDLSGGAWIGTRAV